MGLVVLHGMHIEPTPPDHRILLQGSSTTYLQQALEEAICRRGGAWCLAAARLSLSQHYCVPPLEPRRILHISISILQAMEPRSAVFATMASLEQGRRSPPLARGFGQIDAGRGCISRLHMKLASA